MISKSKDKVLPRRDCGLKRHLALINENVCRSLLNMIAICI
ncbi:hypothetical protein YPPY66_2794 [Yersinia pestis PY-66]|uniref:Transposase n=4 Tax=Yersinia pseudotuberculosis complex TaxID=1649845 RepID=A0AAX2I118_YERPE|nr:hypothetical protein DJ40_186 [Yersinia pseudotuberculosis]AJI99917.1 hypothetical protein BZ18_2793 [Yersinia pestis Pestoides F]AJJ43131.1 hypothetical protein CH63_396 [Yersinia pestis]AJJ55786.1 hypothetical protein BZ17_345 [Yersinia pseudotuberculosis IP 32953]AJJ60949.1 hypothetical protein BZ22_2614 [Yersinia pseudotuberculosis YPIII]AJJ68489.1 hypothetical protein BZ16_1476 [Yersinia pseudotuberculosis PB1/+]AJJ76792.1 hypothetical protein CH57_234 [Yersinia pestis A1122]AJJ81145